MNVLSKIVKSIKIKITYYKNRQIPLHIEEEGVIYKKFPVPFFIISLIYPFLTTYILVYTSPINDINLFFRFIMAIFGYYLILFILPLKRVKA